MADISVFFSNVKKGKQYDAITKDLSREKTGE